MANLDLLSISCRFSLFFSFSLVPDWAKENERQDDDNDIDDDDDDEVFTFQVAGRHSGLVDHVEKLVFLLPVCQCGRSCLDHFLRFL